jgi:hypothetical protein
VCLYLLCFVLFRLCIFILIWIVSTRIRAAATEWQLNCSNNNNNNNNNLITKLNACPLFATSNPHPQISIHFGSGDTHKNLLNNFGLLEEPLQWLSQLAQGRECMSVNSSHIYWPIRVSFGIIGLHRVLLGIVSFGNIGRREKGVLLLWDKMKLHSQWIVQLFDILKVKNALMTPLYYVTDSCSSKGWWNLPAVNVKMSGCARIIVVYCEIFCWQSNVQQSHEVGHENIVLKQK